MCFFMFNCLKNSCLKFFIKNGNIFILRYFTPIMTSLIPDLATNLMFLQEKIHIWQL